MLRDITFRKQQPHLDSTRTGPVAFSFVACSSIPAELSGKFDLFEQPSECEGKCQAWRKSERWKQKLGYKCALMCSDEIDDDKKM